MSQASSETQAPPLKKWIKPPLTKENIDYADIETVDLSLWDQPGGKEKLAQVIGRALSTDGFFYVTNTGFSQEEIDHIFDIAQVPFDEVPDEEKRKYEAKIKETGSFRGYKPRSFWEVDNGVRDRIEQYNLINGRIGGPEDHPTAVRPYLHDITNFIKRSREQVLHRLSNLISLHLELPEEFLWKCCKADNGSEGPDLFRFMVYDPLTQEEAVKTDGVYLKGHTDFNHLSILYSQPITALQILDKDGRWRYVRHRDGACVINIGDQLSFLTGGYLRATIHRVVRPPEDQVNLRRLGVFHFTHYLDDLKLDLITQSPVVAKYGRPIFTDKVPTAHEWEAARTRRYGNADLKKGEKWDEETIEGITVRHYK